LRPLEAKINNALIYGQKCLSDMSLEPQGNVVYENI